jgi:hypothetical protein
MRFGILLGFLLGAAIASLIASNDVDEPGTDGGVAVEGSGSGGLIEKLKRQAGEAKTAARDASEQKQAEMLQDWQQSRRGDTTEG